MNTNNYHTKDKKINKSEEKKTKIQKKNYWLIIVSIILIFLGTGLLTCSIVATINFKKDQIIDVSNDRYDLIKFLQNNSNYSDIIKKYEHDDFWPKEYFEINLSEKKITYWKDNSKESIICYKKYSNSNDCIKFNTKSDLDNFLEIPELNDIDLLVEETFKDAIDDADISEKEKELSLLYNALAGHAGSYVLLGRINDESDWRYFTANDFPQYYIQITDKQLKNIVQSYSNSLSNEMDTPSLSEAFMNFIIKISAEAVSFDFRHDKIYYGNISANVANEEDRKSLQQPFDYTKLNKESACGWIAPYLDKKIIKARDFYGIKHDIIFIDNQTYEKINNLSWNERESNSNFWGKLLFVSGLFFLIVGTGFITYRIIIKNRKKQNITKSNNTDEVSEPTTNDTGKNTLNIENSTLPINSKGSQPLSGLEESQDFSHEIKNLKKLIEEKQKKINNLIAANISVIDNYKKSDDYKAILKEVKSEAVKDFMKSNEFKNILENKKKEWEEEYKTSNSLSIKSQRWDELCKCSSESDALDFLKRMHEIKNSFPKIHSVELLYTEAKKNSKTEIELISNLLKGIDELKDIKLQLTLNNIINEAAYANKIREKFEQTQQLIQEYSDKNEYKQIVKQGKELTIWERLVVMTWSLECINNILDIFKKEKLSTETVNRAIEIHKEDIMQIFATRIFKKLMDDSSAKARMLASTRENIMKDKINEMYEKYHIVMQETPVYTEFVKSLDNIFDKTKNEAQYIMAMKKLLVDDFVKNERDIKDKGQYLSLLIAMGLHMSDYIRYMNGNDIDYCSNVKLVLSGMSNEDSNTEFRYKDPAYSGEYSNRVYEWLKDTGINHLKALVGNRLIMP